MYVLLTYRLDTGNVVDEIPLTQVEGEFPVRRALFENTKIHDHNDDVDDVLYFFIYVYVSNDFLFGVFHHLPAIFA